MGALTGNGGVSVPFTVVDILSQAITSAFEPTTGKYRDRGFLVMPAEDLTLTVISHERYLLNSKSIVGLTGVATFCSAGQWLACPIVAIAASSGKTVNIGII
jgi:hypothetical protein